MSFSNSDKSTKCEDGFESTSDIDESREAYEEFQRAKLNNENAHLVSDDELV